MPMSRLGPWRRRLTDLHADPWPVAAETGQPVVTQMLEERHNSHKPNQIGGS